MLDSGLGGLTVVRALRQALPHEHILYFGDTARVPYGSKSAQTVTLFVRQIIAYLLPHRPKHVVIACNTATALALPALRADFPRLPISGVLEPGALAAVEAAGTNERPVIGVIGTEATVRSGAYEKAIARRRRQAKVITRATPLLVPIVEEGRPDTDPIVRLALEQYLRPMLAEGIDVLVLGCTHYPVYKELIGRIAGPGVSVIDSADKCAQDVRRRLEATGLLHASGAGLGSLRCFVTDNSPRFGALASQFLGLTIDGPEWVSTDDLHALDARLPRPPVSVAIGAKSADVPLRLAN